MKYWQLIKPRKMELAEKVATSYLDKNQVKVKIELSAISNTDLTIFGGEVDGITYPLVLGRHGVGVVSDVAADNDHFLVKGDRVVIESILPCGKCLFCKKNEPSKCQNVKTLGINSTGLFTDFAVVDQHLLHKIPKSMKNLTAIFTEYVSMALNVVEKLQLQKGDIIAILSANKLGNLLAQVVTYYQGIPVVIDSDQNKLDSVPSLESDCLICTQNVNWKDQIKGLTGGRFCDKTVFFSHTDGNFEDAMDITTENGTVCISGFLPKHIPTNLTAMLKKQLTIVAVSNSNGKFATALNLLMTKTISIDNMIGEIARFHELDTIMLTTDKEDARRFLIPLKID